MCRFFPILLIILGLALSFFGCINNIRLFIFVGLVICGAGFIWDLMLKGG